jgi:hypothetical protein
MGKEIPFLSADPVASIEDYERFQNTKAYLKKKSGPLTYYQNRTDQIKELAAKVGYKKFNKFREHRKDWHALERKIPLVYLEAIGADLEVIKFTIELDQEEYEKALELTTCPEQMTIRMMPGGYVNKSLPTNLAEEKVVDFLKDYAQRKEKICWLNYQNLKKIQAYPDGRVSEIHFKPAVEITSEYLVLKDAAREDGNIFLK